MNIGQTHRWAAHGRQTRFLLFAGLFAASIQLAHSSETPALIDRPAAGAAPTQISVGTWVVDIISIDSAQQSFAADIAVVLGWKDPRLAHTGSGVVHYALDQIWHPRVAIANETNSVALRLPETAEVDPDSTVLYRQRYTGSFTQALHLKSFPFDKQTFHVHLVAIRYGPNEVEFLPDQKWVDASLKQGGGISPSNHLAGLDHRKMGYQVAQLHSCAGPEVFGLRLRIHGFSQRPALHFESNASPRSYCDHVVVRFLD